MSLSQPQANRRDEPLPGASAPAADANAMSGLLSFEIWEQGVCPVCGSEDIEYDLVYDCLTCEACGAFSDEMVSDWEYETRLVNALDRSGDYSQENIDETVDERLS